MFLKSYPLSCKGLYPSNFRSSKPYYVWVICCHYRYQLDLVNFKSIIYMQRSICMKEFSSKAIYLGVAQIEFSRSLVLI